MSESVNSSSRKRGGLEQSHPIPRKPRWDEPPSPDRQRSKRDYPSSDRPRECHDLADRPRPRYENKQSSQHDRHLSSERDSSRREYSERDSRRDYHPDREYESCRRASRPHPSPKQHSGGTARRVVNNYPNLPPHLRPQNDKKEISSTTDKEDKPKKNYSKKTVASEANYYGPGGKVGKPQAHSTSSVPASARTRTNGSKNKKIPSLKTEENMSNFGNLVQKSKAPPADNDVIDLSLDADGDDSASVDAEMDPQAAMSTTDDAALPPPPSPKEAPPVNEDKGASNGQAELAVTKDQLAQLQEEVNRLKRHRSAEETLAEEKQKSQEVQNKYEDLMQEYTELGKDYRRVSTSLVAATEQQMELQTLLKTEQEKRHEAETYCKAEQEARIKLQKELEKIQLQWIRDVRELKTKLVKSEIKPDPASGDMTATAQAVAPAAAASVQAESVSQNVAPVKMEPVQVKYEEELWDL